MRREPCPPRPDWRERVEALGFDFHTMYGAPYWVEDACYRFSEAEIDELDDATAELHRLGLAAVERVVAEDLHRRLGIPDAIWSWVANSWRAGAPGLYGRLDLSYDGQGPPKLLEYNADTPTGLLEAAVVQWFWLEETGLGADQFNRIHEALIEAWPKAVVGSPRVHLAAARDAAEDAGTADYLRETCTQAGFRTAALDMAEFGWDGQDFVDGGGAAIATCFKLYPWEWMLAEPFAAHLARAATGWIEPPWKMILANKAILPILWEMAPGHPNLLPAFDQEGPLAGRPRVRKPRLGREGANVTLIDAAGVPLDARAGPYGDEGFVWQALQPLPVFDGWHAVVGSWVIGGRPAGLGLREDKGPITDNLSRFLPHVLD